MRRASHGMPWHDAGMVRSSSVFYVWVVLAVVPGVACGRLRCRRRRRASRRQRGGRRAPERRRRRHRKAGRVVRQPRLRVRAVLLPRREAAARSDREEHRHGGADLRRRPCQHHPGLQPDAEPQPPRSVLLPRRGNVTRWVHDHGVRTRLRASERERSPRRVLRLHRPVRLSDDDPGHRVARAIRRHRRRLPAGLGGHPRRRRVLLSGEPPVRGRDVHAFGLDCEYGSDPNPYCNDLWMCSG